MASREAQRRIIFDALQRALRSVAAPFGVMN